jgi:peptidoglycan hydrolase-like protein with peptidoglycan-binding domain
MTLNRKKIIITVFFGFIIFLIIGFYFILTKQEQTDSIENTKDLFPFGEFDSRGDRPSIDNQGTTDTGNQDNSQEEIDIEEPERELEARLRQISTFPTGGFVALTQLEQKEISDIEIDAEGNTLQTTRVVQVENEYVRYSEIENATIHETKVTPYDLISEIVVDNFIPNAEHSYFSHNGDYAVFQYWNKEDRLAESYLAHIKKIEFTVDQCPFEFKPIELGTDETRIIGIHQFLNRIPQTKVARSGINSPGNESSLVIEATITAIKNFQSIYQIDIDGKIGPQTKQKMEDICQDQQEKIAEEEFENLERKYTISGFFLPQNIISIALNPIKDKLFYLQQDNAGVIGIVRDLLEETKETIFESTFTEWVSFWNNDDAIELNTKPSYAAKSYSYELDPLLGRYFKVLPEKDGLSTLASPNNQKLLITENINNSLRTSIHDKKTNRTRPLTIQTFTDKCVWSPDSQFIYCGTPNALAYGEEYPDTWYQGLETYKDSIWKINAKTFEEEVISDISTEYDAIIDVEKITIDENEQYLYFLDKNTETLWSYRLADF